MKVEGCIGLPCQVQRRDINTIQKNHRFCFIRITFSCHVGRVVLVWRAKYISGTGAGISWTGPIRTKPETDPAHSKVSIKTAEI